MNFSFLNIPFSSWSIVIAVLIISNLIARIKKNQSALIISYFSIGLLAAGTIGLYIIPAGLGKFAVYLGNPSALKLYQLILALVNLGFIYSLIASTGLAAYSIWIATKSSSTSLSPVKTKDEQ